MEEQLASLISDGFEIAKNGNAEPVYRQFAPYLETGQLPARSHYAFGWIIYYALHQQPDNEILGRKKMLANYLKLRVQKPHKLHSMILLEAMRLYRDAKDATFNAKGKETPKFSLKRFADLWDLANLRPGDWRRKEFEGKETSSTVEKFITLYVDEMENTNQSGEAISPKSPQRQARCPGEAISPKSPQRQARCPGEAISQKSPVQTAYPPSPSFMAVIDRAVAEFPDSYNLLSQRAVVHAMCGEAESARSLLKKALLYAPGKFFLWSRLAMLYSPEEEPRKHVALLYKALRSPGQDQFKGRIRLSLAKALGLKNLHHYALWELNRVSQLYESNGWHMPKSHTDISSKIPAGTVAEDPEPLYRRMEHIADEEVYDALPVVRVTKTYHKNPDSNEATRGGKPTFGKPAVAWRVTDSHGDNYWLQPHRFKLPADLPLGTPLNIRLHNSRPVKAELAES